MNVIIVLLRKSDGKDRSIGLVSWLARLWGKLRANYTEEWAAQAAGRWDSAVAGNSPVREAAIRSFMDESTSASRIEGHHHASVLWDIEGFYDALQWDLVLSNALDIGFPPVVLALETQIHMAVRFLREELGWSESIQPEWSLVAGTPRAVDFARCAFYQVCWAAVQGGPGVTLRSWVDDVGQRTEGSAKWCIESLARAGNTFIDKAREAELNIASKSTIISSSMKVARALQAEFKAKGVDVRIGKTAADLGVDRGHVAVFKPKARGRIKQAFRRAHKIQRLAKLGSKVRGAAKKLLLLGALPQASYSAKVFGAAPSQVTKWRRSLRKLTVASKAGRCLTTQLAISVDTSDPAYSLAFGVFDTWFMILKANEIPVTRIHRTWTRTVERLRAKPERNRWRGIRGICSATVATLLQLGWEPTGPSDWTSPRGERFAASVDAVRNQETDFYELKAEIADSVARMIWSGASRYRNGEGLQEVPDLTGARRQINKLRKDGEHVLANAMTAVVTAGYWTAQRLIECGIETEPLCQDCGQEVEDDYHCFWGCSCIKFTDQAEKMRARAEKDAGTCPRFWLRGIVPEEWKKVDPPKNEEVRLSSGELPAPGESFLVGAGDASGGSNTAHSRIRRVAWAFVILDQQGHGESANYLEVGNLPGPRQSVNRGEAIALLAFLEATSEHRRVAYVTDSSYVMRGWARVHRAGGKRMLQSHLDVWARIRAAAASREIEVHKIESHMAPKEAISGGMPRHHFLANAAADKAAEVHAARQAVSANQRDSYHLAEKWGWDVRLHLAKVLQGKMERQTRRAPDEDRAVRSPPAPKKPLDAGEHDLRKIKSGLWRCRICTSVVQENKFHQLRKTVCRPLLAQNSKLLQDPPVLRGVAAHPSHLLAYEESHQVHWCMRCGNIAYVKLQALAKECTGELKQYGRANLKKLENALAPGCKPRWM